MNNTRFISYLIYQYVIMILTPTICAIFIDINPYLKGFIGAFLYLFGGITGLIFIFITHFWLKNELMLLSVLLLTKMIVWYPVLTSMYNQLKRKKWIAYTINSFSTLWAIVIGIFFMVASMQ